MSKNTTKYQFTVSQSDREKLHNHKAFLIWFTGLSGSGKSTIANALEHELYSRNISTYILDGDNIRQGINKDLGFSSEHRTENIRRIAEIANLFVDAGIVTLASFVSPFRKDREDVKKIVGDDKVIEIYVSTSLEECERRDVKGLYQKARNGKITNMTGISAPYEAPLSADLELDTESLSVEDCVQAILQLIEKRLDG
ncbi:MAG: adenylyl-sulfate kinase [Flavobacteriales bacterium]|nr:adenylyl-sulfate kinase [Flavobacteriales bacterium]MBL6873565.1 adenylyl-sulfate kinase [Flavobacteriales bacterium]